MSIVLVISYPQSLLRPASYRAAVEGFFSTGERERAHAAYLKRRGTADEGEFFAAARELHRGGEFRLFVHPTPDTYVIRVCIIDCKFAHLICSYTVFIITDLCHTCSFYKYFKTLRTIQNSTDSI